MTTSYLLYLGVIRYCGLGRYSPLARAYLIPKRGLHRYAAFGPTYLAAYHHFYFLFRQLARITEIHMYVYTLKVRSKY